MHFNNNQKYNNNNIIFSHLEKYMFTNDFFLISNDSNNANYINNGTKNDNKNNSTKKEFNTVKKNNENCPYIPFQKDKLFWCFYIILHGFNEYELHHSDSYITEQNFKIRSIEKLRSMKSQIKETKLKMRFNEIENELVNQSHISVKGLDALCFIYKVSIVVISGKTYYDIDFNNDDNIKKGIIIHTSKDTKEYGIKYDVEYNNIKKTDTTDKLKNENEVFLNNVRNTYWKIENAQKPLNAISGYTIKELHIICNKLDIPIVSELGKNKTKTILYQDLLIKI